MSPRDRTASASSAPRTRREPHIRIPRDVDDAILNVDRREVRLTNLRKTFWGEIGLTKGDLVSVCLPHDWAVFAQQRGYIGGGGPCADQSMPLVKQIGAIGGDPINIEPETIQHIDSHGRPMPEFIVGAYIVPKGMVWLYGNEPRSFDSKYYGPVPESNVLALLKPVITW